MASRTSKMRYHPGGRLEFVGTRERCACGLSSRCQLLLRKAGRIRRHDRAHENGVPLLECRDTAALAELLAARAVRFPSDVQPLFLSHQGGRLWHSAHAVPLKTATTTLLLCLALNGFSAPANPENVLVDGYFFTIPAKWFWLPMGLKSPALSRFVVEGSESNPRTEVRFYQVSGMQDEIHKRLLANFQPGPTVQEQPWQVSRLELVLYSAAGTTIAVDGERPKPDHKIIGLVLPGKESGRAFLIRMLGPREEVDAAKNNFTARIERALNESFEQQ